MSFHNKFMNIDVPKPHNKIPWINEKTIIIKATGG